jgi:tetratricopeptide (TPR) repeat protein
MTGVIWSAMRLGCATLAMCAAALACLPGVAKAAESGWVEVRSAHFVVESDAGESEARRIALEFERVRGIFRGAFAKFRVDPPQPIVIFAARDEATMKMLAPEEWGGDSHIRPSGLFHSDGEKDYVVLRLDGEGTTAFHTIYHEYTHALLFLNFKKLPIWFGEGVAEFFGNSTVGDRDVRTGTADKAHLYMLGKNEWLPMRTLLGVTKDSPYYNEKNPASIFYAESWAVAHYLLVDAEARREQLLNKYLAAWQKSGDPVAAGAEAFGDLDRFGEKIKSYLKTTDWRGGIAVPGGGAADTGGNFAVRNLSEGEVLALRGDFLMHREQLDAAEPLVEQAVTLDAKSPDTHGALGFFEYRSGNYEDAAEEFARAMALGSRDFMTFYCAGVMRLRSLEANEEASRKAVEDLERAAKLNPQFAPTFEALTQAYGRRAETQGKSLEAARKAVELDPESRTYQFGLAYVLLNNGGAAEATDVGKKLLASATTDEDSEAAKKLMATIAEEKEWEEESSEDSESATAGSGKESSAGANAAHSSSAPRPERSATAGRRLPTPDWMALDGDITAVDCGHTPEVTIALAMPKGPMVFHAKDFRRVGVSGVSAASVPGIESCKQWTGRKVKVWFRWVQGEDWVGEISKVYFF